MAQAAPVGADSDAAQDDWWNDLVDLTAVMVESAEQSGALAQIKAASEHDFGRRQTTDTERDGALSSMHHVGANGSAAREHAAGRTQANADTSNDGEHRTASSPFAASASAKQSQNDAAERAGDIGARAFADNTSSARGALDSSLDPTITATAMPAARDTRAHTLDSEARLAGRYAKRGSNATTTEQAAPFTEHAEQSHLATHGAEANTANRNARGFDAADSTGSENERTALSQYGQDARPAVSAHRSVHTIDDDTTDALAQAANRPKLQNEAAFSADAMHADAVGRLSDRIDAMNMRLHAAQDHRDKASADSFGARPSPMRSGEMGLPETDRTRPGPAAVMAAPALDATAIAALIAPAPAAAGPSISIDRVQVTVQASASAKPAAVPAAAAPAARSAPTARGMGGGAGYRSPWASYFTRRD
jgi:hypothetical protein